MLLAVLFKDFPLISDATRDRAALALPWLELPSPARYVDVYGVELGRVDPLPIGINVGIVQSLNLNDFEALQRKDGGSIHLHVIACSC